MDKTYEFIPFEFPRTQDGQYIIMLDDAGVLRYRREQLGLTMQEVADMAGIQLSQYQRLESGDRSLSACSMRIGLSICAVLLLDPYETLGLDIKQPASEMLKPQTFIDAEPDSDTPKKVGRKQIRKDIMKIYVNHDFYHLMIPFEALGAIDSPEFIQLLWDIPSRRILIRPMSEMGECVYDVPRHDGATCLVFPAYKGENPIDAMGWGNVMHELEAEIVRDKEDNKLLFIDLKKAKPFDGKITGPFVIPSCIDDGEEEFDVDDETDFDDEDSIKEADEISRRPPFPHVVYFNDNGEEIRK